MCVLKISGFSVSFETCSHPFTTLVFTHAADIQTMYTLDSVITVVDAKVILDRLAEEKPEGVENESVEQVCFADKILLNKTDLADEAKLKSIEGEIRKLNPTAPILRCVHSKVTPKELLNIRAFDLQRVLDFDPEFLEPDQVSLILCTSTIYASTLGNSLSLTTLPFPDLLRSTNMIKLSLL